MSTCVFVLRTDDDKKDWLWKELQQGRLRQGWGWPGTSLTSDGIPVPAEQWQENFIGAASSFWDREVAEQARKRHRILSLMLEMKVGDLVIVPKMGDRQHFVIAKVRAEYVFMEPKGEAGRLDYGHIIPIDPGCIKEVGYASHQHARTVVKRFTGYQSAVSRVWNEEVIAAATALWQDRLTVAQGIEEVLFSVRDNAVLGFLRQIRQLTPRDLERAVQRAFEKAGYSTKHRNRYDRRGGDADLILTTRVPLLSDLSSDELTVFVQIKQKFGRGKDDVRGVDQLVLISADSPQAMKILVSTADDFSDECSKRAADENVILVNGMQLAELLLRYA